jgi:hypothetical protein
LTSTAFRAFLVQIGSAIMKAKAQLSESASVAIIQQSFGLAQKREQERGIFNKIHVCKPAAV